MTQKIKFNKNKKIALGLFLFFAFFIIQFYSTIENVFAATATDDIIVTLDVTAGITISAGADVTMSPNLGVASNSSIGSSSWTVRTNAVNGYSLTITSLTNPALKSGVNSFADYTEAVAGTPDVWSIASGDKEFGYSAFGTDTPTATWGTGASCGSGGVPTATLKFNGASTANDAIATRSTVTPTSGIATTICFAAEQKDVYAPSGTYTATITATALTL